jgi:nucleotide sugar dehydrogenase
VKLAETTYRDVNIGLANQFAKFAHRENLNIFHIIEASNSQPYSHIHQPGIAVGGHCIPIYPQFYLWNDPQASVVAAARETNAGMPNYMISESLNKYREQLQGHVAVVIGVSYRSGVKESAFSGVFPIKESLISLGMKVCVEDDSFSDEELDELELERFLGNKSDIRLLVIHTPNSNTEEYLMESPESALIVDGRNFISKALEQNLIPRHIISLTAG